MNVEFLDEAKVELIDSALWYEARETGLGRRLRDEIHYILKRIPEAPHLWAERPGGYHRANCPVFPYYIAYVIRDPIILVVAVAHHRRKPEFWKARLVDPKIPR